MHRGHGEGQVEAVGDGRDNLNDLERANETISEFLGGL